MDTQKTLSANLKASKARRAVKLSVVALAALSPMVVVVLLWSRRAPGPPIVDVSREERSPVIHMGEGVCKTNADCPDESTECARTACQGNACVPVWEDDGKPCTMAGDDCKGTKVCQRGVCACLEGDCLDKKQAKCNRCTEDKDAGDDDGGGGGDGGPFGDGGIALPPPGCYSPNIKRWKVKYVHPMDGCTWAWLHNWIFQGQVGGDTFARMGCPYLPPDYDSANIVKYGDAPLVPYELISDPCSSYNCDSFSCPNYPCVSPWPVDPGQVCSP